MKINNETNDDIPMGTPVYIGSKGNGIVYIPVKKAQQIEYDNKIEHLQCLVDILSVENNELKKHLKWSYKLRLRRKQKKLDKLEELEEYD